MAYAGILLAVLFFGAAATPQATATPQPTGTAQAAQSEDDVTAEDDPTNNRVKSRTLQTTYTGATYGPGNYELTQVIPRLAMLRIGKSLLRISFPRLQTINYLESGWGDMQMFYLFPQQEHSNRAYVGVSAQLPTATSPLLGTGKWLAGPAGAYLFSLVPRSQIAGILVQSAFTVAGDGSRKTQSVITVLPFATRFIGNGWYLKLPEAPWLFSLQKGGGGIIPLGLGFGRMFFAGDQAVLLALSDEATVLHANAPNAPKNTIRLTFTVLTRGGP